jgi:dihydrolipoamide dehydrogenase
MPDLVPFYTEAAIGSTGPSAWFQEQRNQEDSMTDAYDVTVIGAGPGGYVAAIRAAQLGLKTAIIEKRFWGGVCLNVGCIPSKALLKNAQVAHLLQHRAREFGFSFDNLSLDYGVAYKRSRQVSSRLVRGVQFLMRKNEIAVYDGTGTIVTPTQVQITLNEGGETTVHTKNLVIATGHHPGSIPGVEIDESKVLSYEHAILLDTLPRSVIVIGAGAIGIEFSYVWNSYGVDVTLVEMMDSILPLEDEEISQELSKAFKKNKVNVLTDTRVVETDTSGDGIQVTVSKNGERQSLQADLALMTGVQPSVDGFGLENIGVKLAERGRFIKVDEQMRTNVPGVYAIGDVTGKLMLAHVASAQGILAAEAIAGRPTMELDYEMMPRAVYCQPQVASFGLTERQAQERGYEVNVGRFPFQANGKALGLGERTGFVKIIADAKYGEILGAQMIGPEVTELLPELVLAHNAELTAAEIARSVHAHPTLSEALMEAAHDLEGHPIHM